MIKCKDCEHYPENCWDWDKEIRKDDRIAHKTKYEEHECDDFIDKRRDKNENKYY